MRRCQSCGRAADVILRDDSAWCIDCHSAALRQGYDRDLGRLIIDVEPSPIGRWARHVAALVLGLTLLYVVLYVAATGGWLRFMGGLLVVVVAVPLLRKEIR